MIAFHLPGEIPVYTFSLLIGVGAGLGLAWTGWQKARLHVHQLLDAGLWVLLASLVGGRLVYIGLNWSYYRLHLAEIAQVNLGGLAWPGALAGGLVGLALFARMTHQSTGLLADGLLPLATSVAVFSWMGCWVDGCAYGKASQAWLALPARDEWGVIAARLPVQLGGALTALASLWLVEQNRARLSLPGEAAAAWLGALAVQMLLAAFLRADPVPAWQGVRMDAWSALVFLGLVLIYWGFQITRTHPN